MSLVVLRGARGRAEAVSRARLAGAEGGRSGHLEGVELARLWGSPRGGHCSERAGDVQRTKPRLITTATK